MKELIKMILMAVAILLLLVVLSVFESLIEVIASNECVGEVFIGLCIAAAIGIWIMSIVKPDKCK